MSQRTAIGSFLDSLSNLKCADFTKMIAIDRKRNSQREHFRSAKKSPEQDLPIVESLLAENTQADA